MNQTRFAGDAAFKRGTDEVRLEFDRGKAGRTFWQRHEATVTAGRVRQRHDRGGVQITVGRQMLLADLEPAAGEAFAQLCPIECKMVGQISGLLGAEERNCIVHAFGPRARLRYCRTSSTGSAVSGTRCQVLASFSSNRHVCPRAESSTNSP